MTGLDGDLSEIDRGDMPQAGTVVYPPRGTYGPRVQRHFQLVLLHRGDVDVEVDGARRRVGTGEVALLMPGHRELFRFARDAETHHSWLALPPRLVPAPQRVVLAAAPAVLPLSPAMESLAAAGVALRETLGSPFGDAASGVGGGGATQVSASGWGGHAVLVPLVTAALTLYVEEAGAGAAHASRPDRRPEHPAVTGARRLVRQRLGQRLDLAELAAAGHVAPEHLVRLFRRHLGTTPLRYLWAERVRLGVYLLEHTGLPVSEVAARAGFQSSYHFSRLVRRETGLPPRELRRYSWSRAVRPPAPDGGEAQNGDDTRAGDDALVESSPR